MSAGTLYKLYIKSVCVERERERYTRGSIAVSRSDRNGSAPKQHRERERREMVVVTWCFMPSQPVRLYQGEGRRESQTDREREGENFEAKYESTYKNLFLSLR